ncbi:MAG: argininosuccinate synthase, partial [Actinomycetes bacterium]
GRKSNQSLYRYDLATYDSEDTYDQSWAKGFIEIFGMTSKIAADRDRKNT